MTVLPGKDTELYKFYRGIDLTRGVDISSEDAPISPVYDTTENEVDELAARLWDTRRDPTVTQALHESRLEFEWAFFQRHDRLKFLVTIGRLIQRFKQDKVVWGVGRGSSCASYLLFLMEVHDINPIKFDIDFREFSKEK